MKKFFRRSGGLIATFMFIPIFIGAEQGGKFNPLTFLLWSALSGVLFMTVRKNKEARVLPACWTIADGFTCLVLVLYFKQAAAFGRNEMMTVLLILICTVLWLTTKTWVSALACTVSLMLAAVPQVVDIYGHPESADWRVWSGYLVSNLLAFLGGEKWTIEDRAPAGASCLLCVLMIVLSVR